MGAYGVPVEWITCMRMSFAAVFFLALATVTMKRRVLEVFKDRSSLLLILGFSLLGITLTQISYLYAIRYAGAGTALLLEQLGLVLVMLYLCLKARRLPQKREFAGLVFALIGAVFISTQGDITTLSIPVLGLTWGLISAVSLAFYNLMAVKPLAKYGSFLVTGLAMLFGAVACTLCFRPWTIQVSLPFEGWAIFAAIIVIGTILAYLLFVQGIKDAGPMRAGLLGSVEPVSGMVISALWLGTPISVFDTLGAIAIVAMIALVTEREAKPELAEAQEDSVVDGVEGACESVSESGRA